MFQGKFYSCISGTSPLMDSLVARASGRISEAFRPKTRAAHLLHLRLFIQFCIFTFTPFPPVSPSPVLAFIEFLQLNGLSPSSISTYIHSIRSKFNSLNLPSAPLYHNSIHLALRSIHLNVPHLRRAKGVFDIRTLTSIIEASSLLSLGQFYSPLFLLAFFAFFRLSNLVPSSVQKFSPLIHLCRGDVIFHKNFATIVVKWSKTLQKSNQFSTIQIPVLGASPLCPVSHLKRMLAILDLQPNDPLFAIPQGSSFTVLTQSKVRKCLASILASINLSPEVYPFHTFRRSGASLAFNSNVSIQSIQKQGTWTSDTVWSYIVANPEQQGSVVSSFRSLFFL